MDHSSDRMIESEELRLSTLEEPSTRNSRVDDDLEAMSSGVAPEEHESTIRYLSLSPRWRDWSGLEEDTSLRA